MGEICAERLTDEICRTKMSADFVKSSHTVILDHWLDIFLVNGMTACANLREIILGIPKIPIFKNTSKGNRSARCGVPNRLKTGTAIVNAWSISGSFGKVLPNVDAEILWQLSLPTVARGA